MNYTLAIIKPDAVKRKLVGKIITMIEEHNLEIENIMKTRISRSEADEFYSIHKGKPFFEELTSYMTSGAIYVLLLKAEDAVHQWRELMGNTDPKKALPETIRGKYGIDIRQNSVHGSDSEENAAREIKFFFGEVL